MTHGYSYSFPALRGTQARQDYYVAMCPLRLIPKLFLFDEEELPPELRAQRVLNKARIPDLARYILDNEDEYVFSAITASIDGDVKFESGTTQTNGDIGCLSVSMNARLVINDGQHRRAAIEEALREDPNIGDETIAVVFFIDSNLKRSQQLFADLNKHAVRPTRSLNILFDYRDPMANLARALIERVSYFKDLVEKEKTTISNRSMKLFTLNAIYQATKALLRKKKGDVVTDEDITVATKFWSELGKIIHEWQLVALREISSAELRREYVHSHSVALHALGLAGASLLEQFPDDWPLRLERLKTLDWARSNPVWEGRALSGGQMSKARQNLQLTANLLMQTMGITLTENESDIEAQHRSGYTDK